MTISLKPEQEKIIQAEIDNGHFHSADEVLDQALAALLEIAGAKSLARGKFSAVLISAVLNGVSARRLGVEPRKAKGLRTAYRHMGGFLLDTNALSEFVRRGEPDSMVNQWLESAGRGSFTRVSSLSRKSDLEWNFFLKANEEPSLNGGSIGSCPNGSQAE